MPQKGLALLLAGLALAALLAVVTLSSQDTATELFNVRPMPSLAEYTAYPAQASGDQMYEYSTMIPGDQTYTYSTTQPGDANYEYSTMVQPSGDYTYNAASDSGLTFYNAEETVPQMTVINGYAQNEPAMEKWYTMPVGTLHPLDTAGDWNSGAFDSINPDGTARASAPLTLSGERDDGTVAAEARSARQGPVGPSHLAARVTELLQTSASAVPVWKTPASKVANLSPKEQREWAKHVVAQHQLHKVWATPAKNVRKLTPLQQKEWAEHVVVEAKKHAQEAKGNSKWAVKVRDLLKEQRDRKEARVAAAKRKQQIARRKARTSFDTFGMAELSGPFSGDGFRTQSLSDIQKSLLTKQPCGPACRQRAVADAAQLLPIH